MTQLVTLEPQLPRLGEPVWHRSSGAYLGVVAQSSGATVVVDRGPTWLDHLPRTSHWPPTVVTHQRPRRVRPWVWGLLAGLVAGLAAGTVL